MKQYYECHITMRGSPAIIKPLVESLIAWKFSAIDGDPVLGDGILCYATKHYNTKTGEENVIKTMNWWTEELRKGGAEVIRQKVELVVYDTKQENATKGSE